MKVKITNKTNEEKKFWDPRLGKDIYFKPKESTILELKEEPQLNDTIFRIKEVKEKPKAAEEEADLLEEV